MYLSPSAIVPVAAGEHKRRFRDRLPLSVLHRHLSCIVSPFHFNRMHAAAVVPRVRIDRSSVMAAATGYRWPATGVNGDVAAGTTAAKQREQFPRAEQPPEAHDQC